MTSLFISHSSEDKPFARRLAHRLTKLGVRVWIDEAELKIGDSLLTKLSEAIESTEFVGAVLSKNSIRSQWVQKELQLALAKEVRSKAVVVLPLLIDEVEIPAFLTDKIYADFRNPHGFDHAFFRLLITIGVAPTVAGSDWGLAASYELRYFANPKSRLQIENRGHPFRIQSAFQNHRVLIFWHEQGLNQSAALHMTGDLSEFGILANVLQHHDSRAPDAVFVARQTPPAIVTKVFACLPYVPTHIFPSSYPSLECGAPSDYCISVGLHSDFHKSSNPQFLARPLPLEAFNALLDTKTPDAKKIAILEQFTKIA